MDKRKFIESIKESLIELLKERGISVELIVVFGSYATER
jgi:predicted nucleotidyltransferase